MAADHGSGELYTGQMIGMLETVGRRLAVAGRCG